MLKIGTHRNGPTSDTTCFRLDPQSLICMPILLSEWKVNIITCIQLPPAQPKEHFLLNYCFNDPSSELRLPATLRSIQKRVMLIAKVSQSTALAQKIDDSGWTMQLLHAERMRNIKRDYLSRATGNSKVCIPTTQCAIVYAKKCAIFFEHFRTIIPRYGDVL